MLKNLKLIVVISLVKMIGMMKNLLVDGSTILIIKISKYLIVKVFAVNVILVNLSLFLMDISEELNVVFLIGKLVQLLLTV